MSRGCRTFSVVAIWWDLGEVSCSSEKAYCQEKKSALACDMDTTEPRDGCKWTAGNGNARLRPSPDAQNFPISVIHPEGRLCTAGKEKYDLQAICALVGGLTESTGTS
jgi:hypothetical protein